MADLGIDLGLLVSQAVNFGALLLVLYAVLFRPLTKRLDERAARVKKGLEDAEAAEQLLVEAQTESAATLEAARREAHDTIEQANRVAEQQGQEILAKARQEAHDIVLRAQQQAQREAQEGKIALQQEIVDLAIASASRLLQENLDDDKQRQLVSQFISEVGEIA
ncbi:MAG: F0F1 ATP synthase subunit B [Chloroflexi bacterium]|nr:F0F1 ATP synthase subunit B [Chloroflexota bacterium]